MKYGATDDFGFQAAVNRTHPHDIHATAMHLLGLDHTKLTFRYSGRGFRLTDVEGRVIKEILARVADANAFKSLVRDRVRWTSVGPWPTAPAGLDRFSR
jgi:hypothetical protein